MRASVLASGSRGNSIWVESAGTAVLVDCGLSVPALRRRLEVIGEDLSSIAAVFITHDHGDHVGSSVALARRLGIPLYTTAGTRGVLKNVPEALDRRIVADEPVSVGPFDVLPFATPHDGEESVAFRVTEQSSRRAIGVVTDLGYVPRQIVDRLRGVNGLVVEHNHDERMLADGPYPLMLKRRIAGMHGHLSNSQGALLASHLLHDGLRHVVLAHLSETNNTPDHARRAFETVNADAPVGLSLTVAQQLEPTPVFDV